MLGFDFIAGAGGYNARMALSFKHHQLANGLDIIAEENPDSHSFAAGIFVKTGARDEDMTVNGVSHFLEHMMFKGSGKYTWEDVNRIFDEIGARYNAYTSQEMTAYYANVLPEFTEVAVEHLVASAATGDSGGGFHNREKRSSWKKSRCISTTQGIGFTSG